MQFVVLNPLRPHRLKRAQANMQRNLRSLDAALAQPPENFGSEVQPCGRRRHRTFFPRIDGLIAFAVGRPILTVNVRGQGHVSNAFDLGKKIGNGREHR